MSTEDSESPPADSRPGEGEDQSTDAAAEPSLVRPYAALPARMVEAPAVLTGSVLDALDEPADEASTSGSGGDRDARFGWAAMRRWLTRGADDGHFHAGRSAIAGATVALMVLLLTTLVLHQAGGWPFASQDTASPRSAPHARPQVPPPAGGATDSPSDRESDDKDHARPSSKPEQKAKQAGDGKDADKDDEAKPANSATPSDPGVPGSGGGSGGGEPGSSGCIASWQVESQWQDFTATITVTNRSGRAIHGWQVDWNWLGDQHLSKTWNADIRQSGNSVTAVNVSNNADISATGEATFGFEATGSGTPAPRLTCRVL